MHTYGLGIDIGDATVVAAVCRDAAGPGRPAEPVQLGRGSAVGPAAVRVDPTGRLSVLGAAAQAADTADVVDHVLGRLGAPEAPSVAGRTVPAVGLLTAVIAHAHRVAARQEGGPAAWAVLAVPPAWDDSRRGLLRDALRAAGLPASSIVTTAVAAVRHAIATGRLEAGSTAAVYDLGASTLDVSVVGTARDGRVEHVGVPPQALDWGGRDVDDAIIGLVTRSLESDGHQLPGDPATQAAVRGACVAAKEALSTQEAVPVEVPLADGPRTVRLVRTDLERLIAPALGDTVDALRRAVTAAGLSVDEIDTVVLAGGSARVPVVAETLTAALGRPLAVSPEPELAAALGAAALAVDELDLGEPAAEQDAAQAGWVPVMPRDHSAGRQGGAVATGPGSHPGSIGPVSAAGRSRRLTRTTAVVVAAFVGVGLATTVLAAVLQPDGDSTLSQSSSGMAENRTAPRTGQPDPSTAPDRAADPAPEEVAPAAEVPVVPLVPTPVDLGTTSRGQLLAATSPLAVFTPAGGQPVAFAGLATSRSSSTPARSTGGPVAPAPGTAAGAPPSLFPTTPPTTPPVVPTMPPTTTPPSSTTPPTTTPPTTTPPTTTPPTTTPPTTTPPTTTPPTTTPPTTTPPTTTTPPATTPPTTT
ncbi:Hsp70 family protein, partial [Modestobacter lapidis]